MVLVLGPQEPYELLCLAMARISVKGKITFAPDPCIINDAEKIRSCIEGAESITNVILNNMPNTDLENCLKMAIEMGKPIDTMYFASESFDRKTGKMKGLTYLCTDLES